MERKYYNFGKHVIPAKLFDLRYNKNSRDLHGWTAACNNRSFLSFDRSRYLAHAKLKKRIKPETLAGADETLSGAVQNLARAQFSLSVYGCSLLNRRPSYFNHRLCFQVLLCTRHWTHYLQGGKHGDGEGDADGCLGYRGWGKLKASTNRIPRRN